MHAKDDGMTRLSISRRAARWGLLLLPLTASAVGFWIPARPMREATFEQEKLDSLSTSEFSRLIQDLSEEDGYFRSDNFTSNETSYLHVVGKLREMRVSGGAYLGVGPEQNFTYIAKVRPHIAFIVDIRRQAMLQHLLYKALFRISESRAEFLSALLSQPPPRPFPSVTAAISWASSQSRSHPTNPFPSRRPSSWRTSPARPVWSFGTSA